MIQRRTQGVDVSARVGASLPGIVLLWWGVLRRAQTSHHRPRARVIGVHQLGQSEINQNRLSLPGDHHILRLDVTMDHASFVTMRKRFYQLSCPVKNLVLGQSSFLGGDLVQPPAVDEIHHQVGVAVLFEVIADARQVGVAQAGQQLRFLLELPAKFGQRAPRGARIG